MAAALLASSVALDSADCCRRFSNTASHCSRNCDHSCSLCSRGVKPTSFHLRCSSLISSTARLFSSIFDSCRALSISRVFSFTLRAYSASRRFCRLAVVVSKVSCNAFAAARSTGECRHHSCLDSRKALTISDQSG